MARKKRVLTFFKTKNQFLEPYDENTNAGKLILKDLKWERSHPEKLLVETIPIIGSQVNTLEKVITFFEDNNAF